MRCKCGELVPISEAFGGRGGSVKALREASPQARPGKQDDLFEGAVA